MTEASTVRRPNDFRLLAELRAERGLTLEAAAELIGLSPAGLYGLEQGEIFAPRGATLKKLEAFYGDVLRTVEWRQSTFTTRKKQQSTTDCVTMVKGMLRRFHPDRFVDPAAKVLATDAFQELRALEDRLTLRRRVRLGG